MSDKFQEAHFHILVEFLCLKKLCFVEIPHT